MEHSEFSLTAITSYIYRLDLSLAQLLVGTYFNQVDDVALESVVSRCSNLQHLNLSWTGGGGQITEQAVCR